MTTLHLNGRITQAGLLDIELPHGLPPGEVSVTIELPSKGIEKPMTGKEIVAWLQQEGGWEDDGLSADEWVEAVRRKEQEKRGW